MGHRIEIFSSPPPDSCICTICHNVLKDPSSFNENCRHTFCDEYAQECLPRKCSPTCRKQVSGTTPNYFARDAIWLMQVKCPNQHEVDGSNKRAKGNEGKALAALGGCGWVGKREDLQDHEKVCSFKLVICGKIWLVISLVMASSII